MGRARKCISIMVATMILFAMAEASKSMTSKDRSEEERLIYLPVTDILTYAQVIKLGFLMLLISFLWGLWYLKFGNKGPVVRWDDFFPNRRHSVRNGYVAEWTDDWYHWFPALHNLVEGVDKYHEVYHVATESF